MSNYISVETLSTDELKWYAQKITCGDLEYIQYECYKGSERLFRKEISIFDIEMFNTMLDAVNSAKEVECASCGTKVLVEKNYEPEYCCTGKDCTCQGMPVNPVFCDECNKRIYGVYDGEQ